MRGVVIRQLRAGRRWTQDDLARRAGLAKEELAQLERSIDQLTPDVIRMLAAAFEQSVLEFLSVTGKQIDIVMGKLMAVGYSDREVRQIQRNWPKMTEAERRIAMQHVDNAYRRSTTPGDNS